MEYAILGNAAFFAVAFAMQMGWLSWDMLGFGQDDDDDVAVKNPDPEPDPEDAKNTNYTASDYASEQVGTSGNDTLGTSTSTESVALFGLTGNDSLVGSASDDYFEGDAGNDTINAFSGNDAAFGGGGTDALNGGAGNDIISSDRLDSSADFSRGAGETLIGAEGEDTIIFSNADQVSGGADADTFHYVYRNVTSDPVVITDFDKDIDTLTVHYTPQTDNQGNPIVPAMSLEIDASIGETLIKLDGVVVAKLQGDITISSSDVTLTEYDATFLDRL